MGVFPSFLFIGSGGSALLTSFQSLFPPDNIFDTLSKSPDVQSSPVSNVPEEDHEASNADQISSHLVLDP